jgi:hypothetical protein
MESIFNGVNFVKYWNHQPYGNFTLWLVVNFTLESYSNPKLKLIFAIHFYSCTISMLSNSSINVLKEETLHCQMMYQLECWYTSFRQCHRWNLYLWCELHQTIVINMKQFNLYKLFNLKIVRNIRWNPFFDTWILWTHTNVSWWLQLEVDSILMVWISSIAESTSWKK